MLGGGEVEDFGQVKGDSRVSTCSSPNESSNTHVEYSFLLYIDEEDPLKKRRRTPQLGAVWKIERKERS